MWYVAPSVTKVIILTCSINLYVWWYRHRAFLYLTNRWFNVPINALYLSSFIELRKSNHLNLIGFIFLNKSIALWYCFFVTALPFYMMILLRICATRALIGNRKCNPHIYLIRPPAWSPVRFTLWRFLKAAKRLCYLNNEICSNLVDFCYGK